MKNIENAHPGVGINCQDGVRREFRLSLLAMRLIQEYYRENGFPEFKFFEHFNLEEHFADSSKMLVLVWAGLAFHEKQQGRLEQWTIAKAEDVIGLFDLPAIIEVIQQAALRSISKDQQKAIEAKASASAKAPKKKSPTRSQKRLTRA